MGESAASVVVTLFEETAVYLGNYFKTTIEFDPSNFLFVKNSLFSLMDLSVVAWIPLIRYYRHMITSFGDKSTSELFHGISSRHARKLPSQIHELALYKLDVLNAAQALDDLRSPPGNRLEALKGVLKGFYGIRINSQWRIIFRWAESGAADVQIMDYH